MTVAVLGLSPRQAQEIAALAITFLESYRNPSGNPSWNRGPEPSGQACWESLLAETEYPSVFGVLLSGTFSSLDRDLVSVENSATSRRTRSDYSGVDNGAASDV